MSAAQLQIILSSAETFAGLISQTLSTDNLARRNAEDLYGQLKQQRPDACASNLLQLMRSSSDARVRSTCAVFLRKFFKSGGKEAGWKQLNRGSQTLVKRELLAALAGEADRNAAKQTADAVVDLGSLLLGESSSSPKQHQSGWSDLLGSLQGWLQASSAVSPVTREAALQVVAGVAPDLRPWSGQLAPVVTGCLAPQHGPEVQVAAMKAVASFVEVLRKPSELRPFQAALAAGLTALQGVLAAGHSAAAEQMLLELIRTAEVEAPLWRPHLRTAVPGMLALAGAGPGGQPLPEELRRLAVEFVLTLIDVKPDMVQEELGAESLASQLVSCLALFLTSGMEDDPAWGDDPMASPDMNEDETLGELHSYGLECGTRAVESLDSGAMLKAVVDMTTAWARDTSDWRRRHAVLLFLSQVVGSCKEVVGPAELASLAGLLTEGLVDPHPRVRWAACHAVGVLCTDLAPQLQLQAGGGGAAMLRGLIQLLVEQEGPACPQRVKAQACRALVGFLEGIEDEEAEEVAEAPPAVTREQLLLPFMEPLCTPLLAAVNRCAEGEGGAVPGGRALVPTPLQESSIDVITRLATSLGSAFAPVFHVAMPPVLAVLARAAPFHGPAAVASGAVTEEEATAITRVQIGALECAAFMCRAAGAAAAAPHISALSAQLGLLSRSDLESSSQLLVPLLNAVEPLAACLGAETRHILAPMLPLLVQWASKDVGLQVDDDEEIAKAAGGAAGSQGEEAGDEDEDSSDDDDDDSDRDDSDMTSLSYGGVSYRCSASVLAAKVAAVSALGELVKHMGPALAQQAVVAADALVPRLLEYPLQEVHEDARRAVPQLLRNYLAALTHGSLPPTDHAASRVTAQALLHRIWQTVTEVIQSEGHAGVVERPAPTSATRADLVEVLIDIVDSVEGTMLQQAWVTTAFGALQAAVAAAQQEAQGDAASDEEDDEDEDKSMEDDRSVDLEQDGSDADDDDDEEEDDGEETEEDESPEAARERLRTKVEACVAAFTRKYGDAVAALAQQVLSQQGTAVEAVLNGVVA